MLRMSTNRHEAEARLHHAVEEWVQAWVRGEWEYRSRMGVSQTNPDHPLWKWLELTESWLEVSHV